MGWGTWTWVGAGVSPGSKAHFAARGERKGLCSEVPEGTVLYWSYFLGVGDERQLKESPHNP